MANLNGEFKVISKNGRYRIYYLAQANMILCSKKTFDEEIDALSYINNHRAELEKYVSKILEEQKSKEDAKLEKETAKTVKKVQKEENKRKQKEEKEKKKQEKKAKREEKKAERKKTGNAIIAAIVATVMFLTGGHFAWVGISNLIEKGKDDKKPGYSHVGSIDPTKEQPDSEISNGINDIVTKDEGLNQENFEELAANFAKIYSDKNLNVTTEDIIKFVSIVNIDSLVEENPELAQELFGTQTKEEYLQDAAKIIGMTYSYNYQIFEAEGTTKNFIRISDSVYGPQKDALMIIESYVDAIALVRNDAEKVNALISELIVRLGDPQSELSYLDNGVGFGMQVYIELIRSYLAKDVISKENFDMLSLLTSSEEYVSNIFTIYDGCMNAYTKTR